MNMQALMMQAKKMQKDMEKSQEELKNKEYEGKSQLVTITMNGEYKVLSVKLSSENIDLDDKDVLEDMILLAVNSAVEKIENDKQEKFGKYGQMFNGLM